MPNISRDVATVCRLERTVKKPGGMSGRTDKAMKRWGKQVNSLANDEVGSYSLILL